MNRPLDQSSDITLVDISQIQNNLQKMAEGERAAFDALLSQGQAAVPILAKALKAKTEDQQTAIAIMAIFSQLAPSNTSTQALVHTIQTAENPFHRLIAAWALHEMGVEPSLVLETFLIALTLSAHPVKTAAAETLQDLDAVHDAIVRQLIELLIEPEPDTKPHLGISPQRAAIALETLGAKAEAAIPTELQELYQELRELPRLRQLSGTTTVADSVSKPPLYCSLEFIPKRLRPNCP